MDWKKTISLVIVTLSLLVSQAVSATDEQRRQAKRIHDRLTGVTADNATIDAMEVLLQSDPTGKSAAEYAINSSPSARYFYNVTLKNFVTPWTNEEQTVFAPLNDYSATAIGLIRDGADFRQILHGDVIYHGAGNLGISAYSNSNNNHYEELEALGPISGDLSNPAILRGTETSPGITQSTLTGLPSAATAGVMTTRAASMAFYSDGTNRAMFRFTLMNHLCTDLEPLKDVTRVPDRVRRDVSRSPGGDSRIFLNGCVGCHAGMDGMAGAFAFYEWVYNNDKSDGHLEYQNTANTDKFDPVTGVSLKHNINPTNFEFGYVTTGNTWINYWRNGANAILGNRPGDSGPGWQHPGGSDGITLDPVNGNSTGAGAKSLGIELSNSRAFAQCQVDKAFEAVCLRDPNVMAADRSARDGFVSNFITPGTGNGDGPYDMREVFTDVAAYCKGS